MLLAGNAQGRYMSYSFTSGQKTFIDSLASRTGLNPRVIGAWVFNEMNGGAAKSRQSARNHNWLNIAYFDSGAGSLTKNRVWRTPESAAAATADFLKGKRFGASSGIRKILNSAGKSAEQQISAIARSGWASSGYNGGSSLRSVYSGLTGLPNVASQADVGGYPAQNTAPAGDRRALILDFLRNRHRPGALLSLATNLRALGSDSTTNVAADPTAIPGPVGPVAGNSPKGMSPLKELIYTPLGYAAKNNARTSPYAQDAHYNHVHVAAGPKTVVMLGKRAQSMGLRVGENPAFGDKVDPVHVANSYHYRNQAIDVSGSPEKMMAFAKYVARLYGVNK